MHGVDSVYVAPSQTCSVLSNIGRLSLPIKETEPSVNGGRAAVQVCSLPLLICGQNDLSKSY